MRLGTMGGVVLVAALAATSGCALCGERDGAKDEPGTCDC